MNKKLKVWILAGITVILFVSSIIAYPLSRQIAKGTIDPDYYESLGWVAMFGFFLLAAIFGIITLAIDVLREN